VPVPQNNGYYAAPGGPLYLFGSGGFLRQR
jgi:hypothetical protein